MRYTWQAYQDRRNNRTLKYHAYQPGEVSIEAGDIIVKRRSSTNRATWQDVTSTQYRGRPTHGDIVVAVSADSCNVIGGNVSNSVKMSQYPLLNGKIDTTSRQNSAHEVFALLKLQEQAS